MSLPIIAALPQGKRASTAVASAFSESPSELAARGFRNPEHAFAQIQRPWLWTAGFPTLGRDDRALAAFSLVPPQIITRNTAADGASKLLVEVDGGARL